MRYFKATEDNAEARTYVRSSATRVYQYAMVTGEGRWKRAVWASRLDLAKRHDGIILPAIEITAKEYRAIAAERIRARDEAEITTS